MSICQTICERYPISYRLPVINGLPLAISFDETLPETLKDRILSALLRFSLPIDEDHATLRAKVCMADLPGANQRSLALFCGESRFYFADGEPSESLAWTLYGLTQELPFLNKSAAIKIRAVVYSAQQQSLASSLLSNVRYWENEITDEALDNILQELLSPHVKVLCSRIPLFGRRPVTEGGWDLICRSRHFFAKKTECTLRELSAKLYGPTNCFEELKALMKHIVDDEEYQSELSGICSEILNEMFSLPPTSADYRLRETIEARKHKLRQEAAQAKRTVELCLKNRVSLKRIEPAEAFAEVDAELETLAGVQIEGILLSSLEERLQEELAKVLPAAQAGVWSWNRELQDFCRIDSLEARQSIGWDFFNRPESQRLRCPHEGWDARRLYALQMNAGTLGRYNREIWFCAPPVQGLCSDDFKPITRPVEHLSASLMVALMSEYL